MGKASMLKAINPHLCLIKKFIDRDRYELLKIKSLLPNLLSPQCKT